MDINFPELEKVSKPLVEWLSKNKAAPHTSVIIDIEGVKVVRTEAFTPSRKTMSEEEIKYRAMTKKERQAVNRALSLEKDSEALNTIKKLSLSRNSDNRS